MEFALFQIDEDAVAIETFEDPQVYVDVGD